MSPFNSMRLSIAGIFQRDGFRFKSFGTSRLVMLDGQFTRLRSVDLADAEWMRRLRTSPVVMQAFQFRYPITDVQQEEFIRGLSANREQLYFVAEDPVGAKPFGVCCLHEIDYRNQRGMRHLLGCRRDRGGDRRL